MGEKDFNIKGLKLLTGALFIILISGLIFLIVMLFNKQNIKQFSNNVKDNVQCLGGKFEFTGKLEDFIQDEDKMIFIIEHKDGKTLKIVDYCNNKIISEINIRNE